MLIETIGSYTDNNAVHQPVVYVDGQPVAADVVAVRRLLADLRTPPERQKDVWIDLWMQWPDPLWGEQCLDEAERVESLLRRVQSLRGQPSSTVSPHRHSQPPSRRHYVWLGDRLGVRTEHLRDGIQRMAASGLIATDREQQDALRRGLGLTVNDNERSTEAPWVVWLGSVDMLWLLIENLWNLKLITCAGGRSQKWRTACGVFLRADGSHFDLTLRNSRCVNPEKSAILEKTILGELRFVRSPHCRLAPAGTA